MNLQTGPAFLIFIIACTSHPAWAEKTGDPEEARDAIKALIHETQETNNAGDVEAWVDLFAHDAVYMPPGSPSITARQDLIEVARAGFRHEADIDIEPLEIRVAGDWAFARNRVSGTVTVHGSGEVVPVDVKQIVIYTRDPDGVWKIARLISNSNAE